MTGIAAWLALLVPWAWLEVVRLIVGEQAGWPGLLIRLVFAGALVVAAAYTRRFLALRARCWWPATVAATVVVGLVAAVYALRGATALAWLLLAVLYLLLMRLRDLLAGGSRAAIRLVGLAVLAALAGATPVVVAQIQGRFSEEEFFVALQALVLSVFFGLLVLAEWLLTRPPVSRPIRRRAKAVSWGFLLLLTVVQGAGAVEAYQRSFYPAAAPGFAGISPETPFLCGSAPPASGTVEGEQVFRRLMARVAANPVKGTAEYGMLALGTGERRWAESFREQILADAQAGLFTAAANSVKSVQYHAALRVYYYPRVREAFPDLFTAGEDRELRNWFAAINRRALTREWVDLLYAFAFRLWPEGPYENQETGAGLLAMLEVEGLADPRLSAANRDYLARNRRGWTTRFRNTDDAIIYQPEWLDNAYFQSLYTGDAPRENVRRSFDWLLLQALPDVVSLRYNHPYTHSMGGVAYVGARLLDDPYYLWLADQSLARSEETGERIFARPGAERPIALQGRSPGWGSCLLYADSGLPNQVGPLAPDKIVFRDGWSDDASYLLLNLRFTGWHRYKATNTVTLWYQGAPLVAEALVGQPFSWLPEGRSFFRDKRIPRENLNGLVVERTGLSRVLYDLTGIGGPWAQDPPFYASVERFEAGAEADASTTELAGWQGWQHRRTVYFRHQGPAVILDDARGPAGQRAALLWHAAGYPLGEGQVDGSRIHLRGGEKPAEMVLVPLGQGTIEVERQPEQGGNPNVRIRFDAGETGQVQLATVLLTGPWVGAEVSAVESPAGRAIRIARGEQRIELPVR